MLEDEDATSLMAVTLQHIPGASVDVTPSQRDGSFCPVGILVEVSQATRSFTALSKPLQKPSVKPMLFARAPEASSHRSVDPRLSCSSVALDIV